MMLNNNDLQPLKNCPWCDREPLYISTPKGFVEIWCTNERCLVRPIAGFPDRFKSKIEANIAWNNPQQSTQKEAKYKPKQLIEYNNYIHINTLKQALNECVAPQKVWEKYLPNIPYLEE